MSEKKMRKGYWWQCEDCHSDFGFKEVSGYGGVATFIRHALIPSGWNQSLLLRKCPSCEQDKLRVTYELKDKSGIIVQVIQMVGLGTGDFIPMMWETHMPKDGAIKFDFKYTHKNNPIGLNRPAIFSHKQLKDIFDLYCEKTGKTSFP